MADKERPSESDLSARYTKAVYRFARADGWREYLELADEFRALDTYKDSAQFYTKCVKGASAPAYREITESIKDGEPKTAADLREAARIMGIIQDYSDARELMRVYTVKANALIYAEAVKLISDSEATTEELGQGVEFLKSIKGFKDTRDLIDRYEKYYFERMYRDGLTLLENGHVWSEFEEAAEIFERISIYSDAAAQAAIARKRANQLKPKSKRSPKEKPSVAGDEATRVRPAKKEMHRVGEGERAEERADGETTVKPRKKKREDETVNNVLEVWRTIDKRRLVFCVFWLLLFVGCLYASILIGQIENDRIAANGDTLRMVIVLGTVVSGVMSIRCFFRMLTVSMRKKLQRATLAFAKKLAAPFIKATTKLLAGIGIDLSRRHRLGGRDEKTIVHMDENKSKKYKKRLKNELKWAEQSDNAARVRFIFIDYMIRRIKEGYFMRYSMTPGEIAKEIADEDAEKELFRVYEMARYAGRAANDEITDAMVGELKAVSEHRNG